MGVTWACAPVLHPWPRWAPSSVVLLCSQVRARASPCAVSRSRGQGSSLGPLYEGTSPIRGPHPRDQSPPKGPTSPHHHLGVRIPTYGSSKVTRPVCSSQESGFLQVSHRICWQLLRCLISVLRGTERTEHRAT